MRSNSEKATGHRIVLVGNPNVGKSALFSALTGQHATVANYPGTTVEVAHGRSRPSLGRFDVIDSPGVDSLVPLSEDERVTVRLLKAVGGEQATVVLQVADAKNLRRALLLTLQLGEIESPTVLALNMADEAADRGLRIDAAGLSEALGVPVRFTVATRGDGVAELAAALPEARPPKNHLEVPSAARGGLEVLRRETMPDESTCVDAAAAYNEALLRYATELSDRYVRATSPDAALSAPTRWSRRAGALAIHPVWGWPILIAVLAAMYEVVGVFGAGVLVDLMEERLFGDVLNPLARWLFTLVPIQLVQDLLVGPYGLITMGLTYGLAIVLPIVTMFFVAFGVLEDSGYLPRLAVMSDRALRTVGLNGKAVLPMVLGLGCDTMATMTTRILATRKERLLVTLLLALGVPCSAQLGVILAMLAVVPASAGLVWLGSVVGVMVAVGWLAARVLPGRTAPFLVELPPMRWPVIANVLAKTAARVEWYLKEALPLFLLGTLVLFVLDRLQLLKGIVRLGEPLVAGILGLPPAASEAFLIGFLRRDFAATRLFDMSRHSGLDTVQLVVSMVTITLFIPCIANVFMIVKERGWRAAAAIVAVVFPLAFAAGGVVRLVMRGLGFWSGS